MGIVQNKQRTTQRGGITGRGFMPGQSGNPSGRPKGFPRRVRELVGEDGEAIIQFMLDVMHDETARTADRIEAAKWLGDRGFGRSVQGLEIDVTQGLALDIKEFSTEDLDAFIAILDKYDSNVAELTGPGEIPVTIGADHRPPA